MSEELKPFAFFAEYGCPKGKWGMSKRVYPKYTFTYRRQKIDEIDLLKEDCVKGKHRNSVCEDCPVGGLVPCGMIRIWQNYGG